MPSPRRAAVLLALLLSAGARAQDPPRPKNPQSRGPADAVDAAYEKMAKWAREVQASAKDKPVDTSADFVPAEYLLLRPLKGDPAPIPAAVVANEGVVEGLDALKLGPRWGRGVANSVSELLVGFVSGRREPGASTAPDGSGPDGGSPGAAAHEASAHLRTVLPAVLDTRSGPLQIAVAAAALGRGAQAREVAPLLEAAKRNSPEDSAAYQVAAAAALVQGEPKTALAEARRAVQLAPSDPNTRRLLRQAETSAALQEEGRRAVGAAQRGGRLLKAFAPEEAPEGEGSVGVAAQAGGERAEGAAPDASSAARQAARRLLEEARRSRDRGDAGRALEQAARALELHPGLCDAINLRASLYNRMRRHGEAAAEAARSLELCGENAAALDARAFAYNRLGEFRRAGADADRSIQLAPSSPYGRVNRAEALGGLRDLRGMVSELKKAAALDSRFYERYRAAAQENGFPVDPPSLLTDAGMYGAGPAGQAAHQAASGRSDLRLLAWVVGTLIGGFLIAAGLLRLLAGRRTTRRSLEAARPTPSPPPAAESDGVALRAPYILRRPIGRGGMGVVYDAWDTNLERRVAVKKMREELKIDPRERDRFLQEARLVAGLSHPSIVGIHSVFEEDRELYLVFEYVDGRTLDALLRERERLEPGEAAALLKPVCDALDYAHSKRVVHRDLKPSNIMIGPGGVVKVMDFGIARQAKDSLARLSVTQTVAGTPLYMAPECEMGTVGRASDLFSLGVLAYELLAGSTPYPPPGSAAQKLSRSYARLSALEPALAGAPEHAVDAALDPDPARRPESAGRFWELFSGKATPPLADAGRPA